MKIMVDYDGTYTADVTMWREVILEMIDFFHEIYIVTSRDPADLVQDHVWFEEQGIPVIYCNYHAKRQVCEQQGIAIDIWIDNQPYFIDHGYPEEEAKKWRVG
jgi:hypothetical protein